MSQPTTQTAAILLNYSLQPEGLKIVDNHPIDPVEQDTVLVKSRYASVNPVDYKLRNGTYPWIQKFPHVLGVDGKL